MSAARLLLPVAVLLLSAAMLTEGLRMASGPKSCCFSFVAKPLKLSQVTSYRQTSQQCPNSGVVFTTPRGYKLCARSTDSWVQDLTSKFNRKMSKNAVEP